MWPRKKKTQKVPSSPELDPTSIGNLILREGLCTQKELQSLVETFHKSSIEMLLGKFLVGQGILTQERLEVLLIKQEAERQGSVDHRHVMKAMEIASSSQDRVSDGVDRLNVATAAALAKVEG